MNTVFIGRKLELDALRSALPTSADSPGRFVAIIGGPGLGKTRLMGETERLARAQGCQVLWSQMIEDPGAPPYFLWMPALRDCLTRWHDNLPARERDSLGAELASIVPEFGRHLRAPRAVAGAAGTAARFRLFDAVTRLLLAASKRQPVVLLLDNLHLADESSLALLEYFCQQIANTATLVVGASRELQDEHCAPLRRALNRLSRTTGFERLVLAGLSLQQTAELIHSQLGAPAPAALVETLHAQSDGNPLFVNEVAAALARRTDTVRPSAAALRFRVPESLHELIAARLAGLSAESYRLLGVAAVLGRDFDANALSRLCAAGGPRLSRGLQEAEAAGIVFALRPGHYRFQHALFREVLYAEHDPAGRVAMHSRAADHMAVRYVDDLEPHLSQLAYHYFEAAQPGRTKHAIEFCQRAAQSALQRHAYADSAYLFERALEAVEMNERPDSARRFELLVALGGAQYRSGQVGSAAGTLLSAALLAHRRRWWLRLAEAVLEFQFVQGIYGTSHVASVPLHETVLAHVPEEHRPIRARVQGSLAMARLLAGQRRRAEEELHAGVALARQCSDPEVLLHCLRMSMWVLLDERRAREQLAMGREALALARQTGSAEMTLDAFALILFPLCKLGEVQELKRLLPVFRKHALAVRHMHHLNLVAGLETAVAILEGRWHTAIRTASEAVRQATMMTVVGLEGRFGFQIFAIQKARGALQDLAGTAERFLAGADESRLWLPGAILLHCELGQHEEARAALQRLGNPANLPQDELYVISLVYLAEACARLSDRRRGRQVFELLNPYGECAANVTGTMLLGAVSGYLALLAVTLRRSGEARAWFEHALEMNTRMGAAPALARCRVDYAAFLLQTGRGKDRARAVELLALAKPVAASLELEPVRRLIAELESGPRFETLTQRELAVLEHVAAGDSNKKIAGALNITHSTVATHVRSILRKIDAANRTEAAALARRRQLLLRP